MSKCCICNTTSNLVYHPSTSFVKPGQNLMNCHIWCERCYAKTNFPEEYPNLPQYVMSHINSLPKIHPDMGHLAFSNSFNPCGQDHSPHSYWRTNTTSFYPRPSSFSSFSEFVNACRPAGSFQPENKTISKPRKKDDDKTAKKPIISDTNASASASATETNICMDDCNGELGASEPNESKSNKLNNFIKKVLFPELMDFQDNNPPAKNPKLDIPPIDDEEQEKEDKSDWPFEWIGGDIKSIKDLIRIGREYKNNPKKVQTNLDMKRLSNVVEPLETLNNMVGLEDIKDSIFKQVIFHLQDLDNGNKDMHHTVIKGPPGVGKTHISHIIARIYKGLGFLKKDTVVSVKRDDLIAGYLGQTAIKAKKKYEEALGGVLLIDEAYALGDGSDKDSFSKEAIDLLTSYLSEHGHEFICIIAGYKDALEKRFFSINEGLARRFNIHYEIKPYSGSDICQIFLKLVSDGGWELDPSAYNPDFFTKNIDSFPHFGGDIQNLFTYTKKAHSTRLLSIRTKEQLANTKKKINMSDLELGFEQYKLGNGYSKDSTPFEAKFMYM